MKTIDQLLAIDSIEQLSPISDHVERTTARLFSKDITMFTPIYISNYCTNECTYCAFKKSNNAIERSRLTLKQIEDEFKVVKNLQFEHIIIVGGEDIKLYDIRFLTAVITLAKQYFTFVALEIQPLSQSYYQKLADAGLDGVAIYQETYDRQAYEHYHVSGPKSYFEHRKRAVEAAIKGGIKSINVGVLLGLGDYETDIRGICQHIDELQQTYPHIESSLSLLRIKPIKGEQSEHQTISDFEFVKALLIIRYLNPRLSLTMSTREPTNFKQNLLKFGVKRVSASVSTSVGGHTINNHNPQFMISDDNSLQSQMEIIRAQGYIPVLKDWS